MSANEIPQDGLAGLKQNWKADVISGFLVFLLALPLSLGIAKASEFPAAMGVLTAMVGGLVVTIFAGSRMTIKGPAAGLITICSGAVIEMGGGAEGWHLALGAIVVAAAIQVICSYLGMGSLSDFFPPSVVHGMLAAIGLIIFAKQIHVLLGIDPADLKGMGLFQLYGEIPHSLLHADPRVALVGGISLLIIFLLPVLQLPLIKNIPAPMIVLLVTVPMATIMDFRHTEPAFDLVSIGDFWSNVGINVDFGMISTMVFWKYVLMFFFINSLESLLTVKAIDGVDPYRRASDPNKDLRAIGIGNGLSAMLGGLPMISEVARSSANIMFGAKTRWSNFFHGGFLLIAMLLFIPVIEMIPNAALAALLIAVGYRLAAPHEFYKVYKIGPEQLLLFVLTVIVTLATDLLMGVATGILAKLLLSLLHGVAPIDLFKAHYEISKNEQVDAVLRVTKATIFCNLMGFKKVLSQFDPSKKLVIDFSEADLLDHTFLEFLSHLGDDFERHGGELILVGFDRFKPFSNHPLAARKRIA